eukprot:5966434-Amphidinium_carterae.1
MAEGESARAWRLHRVLHCLIHRMAAGDYYIVDATSCDACTLDLHVAAVAFICLLPSCHWL